MVHSRYWLGINYSDVEVLETLMMTSSDSAGEDWFVSIKYHWLLVTTTQFYSVDDNIYDSSLIVSSTSYSLISDGSSETERDGSWWWSPDTSCCCPHTHSLLFTVVNTQRSSLSNLRNQTCHSFIVCEAKTYLLQVMTPPSISLWFSDFLH